MKSLLSFFFALLSLCVLAQEPHENPDHVKGNSATIYQALPFYNEACEYYANGDTVRAKKALIEAINTSFALTEAHLFLADIYSLQGQTDSAFYFYNSGIDFAIEQDPNYYFKLFQTGMLHGQYDFIKHNLKHFDKLYGNEGAQAPYEIDYDFDRTDYEYYLNCVSMVYDYKSWQQKVYVSENLKVTKASSSQFADKKLILVKSGKVQMQRKKKHGWKSKALKGLPSNVEYAALSSNGEMIVFTKINQGISEIYVGERSGKSIKNIHKLAPEVNDGSENITPFLHENSLYFASNRTGNFDLYHAKLSNDFTSIVRLESLTRVNSEGDDIAPSYDPDSKVFYFSSNGHLTFGGFDILECTDHEIVNSDLFPINPRNPGASFNSYHDEIQVTRSDQNYLLHRKFRKGGFEMEILTPTKAQEQIYFEITPIDVNP
ncbi:MAG: hypothetical protein Crog4KO_24410 [Crocinitomicaceae bacterium]